VLFLPNVFTKISLEGYLILQDEVQHKANIDVQHDKFVRYFKNDQFCTRHKHIKYVKHTPGIFIPATL